MIIFWPGFHRAQLKGSILFPTCFYFEFDNDSPTFHLCLSRGKVSCDTIAPQRIVLELHTPNLHYLFKTIFSSLIHVGNWPCDHHKVADDHAAMLPCYNAVIRVHGPQGILSERCYAVMPDLGAFNLETSPRHLCILPQNC